MRRLILLLAAVVLLPAATCMPDQQFVKGVDGYAKVILPEYERYLDADPNLTDDDKAIRKDSANGLRALIEEAKEDE